MKKAVMFVATFDSTDRLIKFKINEDSYLDILDLPLKEMYKFRQIGSLDCEAGGLLIGYENYKTGNYTVGDITGPGEKDIRSRILFIRKDRIHIEFLDKKKSKGGYIGTWHTHPQTKPIPSKDDIIDWKECLELNSGKNRYLIFIIIGTEMFRVWVGDCHLKRINEVAECKASNGIYTI